MFASVHIQSCHHDAFPGISNFVWQIYASEIAPYNSERGHRNFRSFVSGPQFINRASQGSVTLEALKEGQRIGMCEFRHQHIFLLFTDPTCRHQGIGKRLLQTAQYQIKEKGFSPFLTLNASPNAVPFYEKLGFRILAPEGEKNGLKSTLMKLDDLIS